MKRSSRRLLFQLYNRIFGTPDIPFAESDAARFVPWILGLMVFLAALLLFSGASLHHASGTRLPSDARTLTVYIPAEQSEDSTINALRNIVRAAPGVREITQKSKKDLASAVSPWFGDSGNLEALPLPTVLEAEFESARQLQAIDADALRAELRRIAPGSSLDTAQRWVEKLQSLRRTLQSSLALVATFIIGTMALMVVFVSREAVRLYTRVVRLLHALGADDDYIARQFQRHALMLTLRGALPATVLALIIYGGLGLYLMELDIALLPDLSLTGTHTALILLLPLTCMTIAWIAARMTVLAQLKSLP